MRNRTRVYVRKTQLNRGLQKMKLRCTLALMVMMAMAVGRIREKQEVNMRSLVKAA
ncbi:MAG: hypothetical protein ACOY9Y_04170 [Bacillota bacterium]